MNRRDVVISIGLILLILLAISPYAFSDVEAKGESEKYFEYPTETWVIERQDYFGRFLVWDFVPLAGQSGDKTEWLFSWLVNETSPFEGIREHRTDKDWLKSAFDDLKTVGFKNYGDFLSDCKRLDKYPVSISPQDRKFFLKSPKEHISLLEGDSGNFTFTLKEWIHGVRLQIGFKTTITYSTSTNTITCTGGEEGSEIDCEDLYNADKSGTFDLHMRTGITGTDGSPVSVDNALRPTDKFVLGGGNYEIEIVITNWVNMTNATIRVHGTDYYHSNQEDVYINADGHFQPFVGWHTITHTQVVGFYNSSNNGSFDYRLYQGQWGVVWRIGSDNQYLFDCDLEIGDDGVTPTWFKDTNVQVTFTSSVSNPITITENVHFTMGEVLDANAKTVQNGVSIHGLYSGSLFNILHAESGSNATNLYDCHFYSVTEGRLAIESDESYLWGCTLDHVRLYHSNLEPSGTYDAYRVEIKSVAKGIDTFAWGTFNDFLICSCTDALYITGAGATTYENLKTRNCTYLVDSLVPTSDKYLINADSDNWAFKWFFLASKKIYRQYTFDLTTTPNATVEITYYGQGGGTLLNLTDLDGIIPTQTISKGFYNQTGADTIYSYEPFHLKISKDGYQTYEANFTLSEKTAWEITLQQSADFPSGFFLGFLLMFVFAIAMISVKVRKN